MDSPERVVESVEGFVEHLGPRAEVVLFVDGGTERFFMPRTELDRLGIGVGDGFWLDAVDCNGVISGKIRALGHVASEAYQDLVKKAAKSQLAI